VDLIHLAQGATHGGLLWIGNESQKTRKGWECLDYLNTFPKYLDYIPGVHKLAGDFKGVQLFINTYETLMDNKTVTQHSSSSHVVTEVHNTFFMCVINK
jgi:hypothetical protein